MTNGWRGMMKGGLGMLHGAIRLEGDGQMLDPALEPIFPIAVSRSVLSGEAAENPLKGGHGIPG